MRFYTNIYILVVFLAFFSCKKHSNINTESSKRIKLESSETLINLEDIIEIEEVIKLETNKISLFGQIDQLIVSGDKLFIREGRFRGLVFNSKGKHLYNIGKKGKGPNEYLEFRDISLDTVQQRLSVLDYKKILNFNSRTGEFINSFKINIPAKSGFNPDQFFIAGNDTYYLWSLNPDVWNVNDGSYYFMYKYVNGKITNKYYPYKNYSFDGCRFFKNFDGSVTIRPPLGDYNIYTLSDDSIYANYYCDFGNSIITQDFFSKSKKLDFDAYYKLNCFRSLESIHQTKDHLYLTCDGPNKSIYELILNKAGSQDVIINKRNVYNPYVCYADENYFYAALQPEFLQKVISENRQQSIFHKTAIRYNLTINDNPLLFKFKIIKNGKK